MNYCIYNYTVRDKDGNYKSGVAPYYGNSINEAFLIRHVKSFFVASPELCEEIKVAIIDKPTDEKEFLKLRVERDANLAAPRLLDPSLQI